jgi:hypothetical protein
MGTAPDSHDRAEKNYIDIAIDRKLIRPYKRIPEDIAAKDLYKHSGQHRGKAYEAQDIFKPVNES